MLSCRIVIHKSASNEKALLLKINVLLRMWAENKCVVKNVGKPKDVYKVFCYIYVSRIMVQAMELVEAT